MRIRLSIWSVERTLRINHKRPSSRVVHNNSVVNREGIHRETGNIPGTDLHRAAKSCVQGEWLWTRNLLHITLLYPARYTVLWAAKDDTKCDKKSWYNLSMWMLVMNFDLGIDASTTFSLELKGLCGKCFLFFFGNQVQIITYSDGMNTGWCRNNWNHVKNQSEVEINKRKCK